MESTEVTLVGTSAPMVLLREQIARLRGLRSNVHVNGERGSGKELVARAIGQTRSAPFVALNSALLSRERALVELWGAEPNSYTGCTRIRYGYFDDARGGTLFLDEVADFGSEVQGMLLRVVEYRLFRRLGGRKDLKVELRLITATNKDFGVEVDAGRMREDLVDRITVTQIDVPPLRARAGDIPELVAYFTEREQWRARWTPTALEFAKEQVWPGNVRQLQAVAHQANFATDGGVVTVEVIRACPQFQRGLRGKVLPRVTEAADGGATNIVDLAAARAASAATGGAGWQLRLDAALEEVLRTGRVAGDSPLDDVRARMLDVAVRLAGGRSAALASLLNCSQRMARDHLERARRKGRA